MHARAVDVTDAAAVDRIVAEWAMAHGRLDAVIHAAGIAVAGPVEGTDPAMLRQQIDTNLLGPMYVGHAAIAHLRASTPSVLVYVSSLAGRVALPYQAAYSAAKFGLEGFCQALRFEVEPYGVRVVVVQPGSVRTGMTASRATMAMSPLYDASARALAINDEDERSGVEPVVVAGVIEAVLSGREGRETIPVGHFRERIVLPAQRWLPARWIHRALAAHFGLRR